LRRSFSLKSLNFPQGVAQVSSTAPGTSAHFGLTRREIDLEKFNSRVSAGGMLMPVFIGVLRRSDAAQWQNSTAQIRAFRACDPMKCCCSTSRQSRNQSSDLG
jgi:hypothetical protein